MIPTHTRQQPAPAHPRQIRLECGFYSDIGSRPQNEDSAIYYQTRDGLVAIVADGMGGGVDGKIFSERAVNCLQAIIPPSGHTPAEAALKSAVQRVVHEIKTLRLSKPDYQASGTTLVVVSIKVDQAGSTAFIVHIGDSRIYRITAQGETFLLTRDHTYAESLIQQGVSSDEAYLHPQARQLTHALGDDINLADTPGLQAFTTIDLQPDDRLLLCTDGVSKYVPQHELAKVIRGRSAQQAAHLVVQQALKNGSKDNVTAIVVSCERFWRLSFPQLIGLLVAFLVCAFGLFGAIGLARGNLAQSLTTPTVVYSNAVATFTPLPPSATRVLPTREDVTLVPSSTSGPSVTPTSTPTLTPTATPTLLPPTRTSIPLFIAPTEISVQLPPTSLLAPPATPTVSLVPSDQIVPTLPVQEPTAIAQPTSEVQQPTVVEQPTAAEQPTAVPLPSMPPISTSRVAE